MKRLFLLCIVIAMIVFVFTLKIKLHPIKESTENINIGILYHQELKQMSIKPYTKLDVILKEMHFNDDVDYRKLNLSHILSEGDLITIPIINDVVCISINHDPIEVLMGLKGVGEKTAEVIIHHRETQGLFKSIEDIMKVKGIGPKKFEKMAAQLCL